MQRNKPDKKFLTLEPDFNDIFVSKDGKADPFVEIFVQEPENVAQQALGTIAGVFEINDESEKSSYIVNYLISVIKKEYFAATKRGAIESFEAALHKANLVLAKLAEHGTVEWLGKFNAVCAVIEKNNVHFSSTGTAAMFLLRAKSFTNISEGEEAAGEPNPLKTFQDVVSGRMEDGDKLLLTTDSIFSIFSPEELKKSALKFSEDEFVRFLKTALVNELEKAAVLVVDIKEKELPRVAPAVKKTKKINAFSQETFLKKAPTEVEKEKIAIKEGERQEIIKGLKEEYEKTKGEFVDKKTGHIYIKEDFEGKKEESSFSGIKDYGDKLIGRGGKLFSSLKEKARPRSLSEPEAGSEIEAQEPEPRITIRPEDYRKEPASIAERLRPLLGKLMIALSAIASGLKIATLASLSFIRWKIIVPAVLLSHKAIAGIISKIRAAREKSRAAREMKAEESFRTPQEDYLPHAPTREEKRTWFEKLSDKNRGKPESVSESSILSREEKAFPGYPEPVAKTKNIFSRLDYNQKIYLILALVLIFIVPYFIAKFTAPAEAPAVSEQQTVATPALPLENDKNVTRMATLEDAYQGDSSLGVINVRDSFFAVGKNEIFSLSDQKSYPIPDSFADSDLAFGMDDLNFIFLLKGRSITSWSTVSKKFQDNSIEILESAKFSAGRSYLTYIYLSDAANNQIYRYPRAEGGFGAKTNWLKDTTDLSNSTDMAINENVFVADGGAITKLFRGQKQDFTVEETATPIKADKLYTKQDSQNLYVLDKDNSRIITLDQDGKIVKQYYNPDISSFDNFSIDETAKIAYLASESAVKKLQME